MTNVSMLTERAGKLKENIDSSSLEGIEAALPIGLRGGRCGFGFVYEFFEFALNVEASTKHFGRENAV